MARYYVQFTLIKKYIILTQTASNGQYEQKNFIKKQVDNIKEVLGVTGKLFMTLMKNIPQQNLKGQANLSLIFF